MGTAQKTSGGCQAKAGTELSRSLASQTGSRHSVTSLVGKEQELVWEVEQYQLDMADLTGPSQQISGLASERKVVFGKKNNNKKENQSGFVIQVNSTIFPLH